MRVSLAILILAAGPLLSQTPSDYQSAMQQGRRAIIAGQYGDAVSAYQRAADLEPTSVAPRMALADTLMRQYDPSSMASENLAIASRSKAEFLHVLEIEPRHSMAAALIGVLLFGQASAAADAQEQTRLLEESRDWYRRAVAIDARSRQGFYALCRIAWLRWSDYQGSLFR